MKTIRTLALPFFLVLLSGCLPFQTEPSSSIDTVTLLPTATAVTTAANDAITDISKDSNDTAVYNESVLTTVQSIFQQIYQGVNPSVVNIQVTSSDGWYTSTSQGSGFIWDVAGHIVTNNHVIEDASQITVIFADETSVDAQLVGTDPQSDLAVIQVDPQATQLIPVTMGDSHNVYVGDLVIAIGNPYGLTGTMTQGIVSALSRSLTVDDSDQFSYSTYTIPDIIQTDAAINPGNSGGVLVNVSGEVIGVTSAIQSSTSSNAGIGFVIPAHIVTRIVPELITNGTYDHPDLGFSGITLTSSINEQIGLDSSQTGILITSVEQFGPAEEAGLTATTRMINQRRQITINLGDIVTAIDGNSVKNYESLISYIFNQTTAGQTVSLTIVNNGKEKMVELTLASSS